MSRIWRFPLDWKNPVGYIFVSVFVYVSTTISFYFMACILCLVISIFRLLLALIEDTRITLNSMKLNLKIETDNKQQMMDELLDFIKLHSVAKQLNNSNIVSKRFSKRMFQFSFRTVHEFSEVCEPNLMALFTWNVVTICCSLLILQIELVRFSLDLILVNFCVFYLSFLFIYF